MNDKIITLRFTKLSILFSLLMLVSCRCPTNDYPSNHSRLNTQAINYDFELKGITFYVWGGFPSNSEGVFLNNGSSSSINHLIRSHGGSIATNPNDNSISVAVIGDLRLEYLGAIENRKVRRLELERINRQKNKLYNTFLSNDVEVISIELLLSRLGYSDLPKTEQDELKNGVWDHVRAEKGVRNAR